MLRKLAFHEAADCWRKRRSQARGLRSSLASAPRGEADFEERIERDDLLSKMPAILDALAPAEREALHLRFFKDCTILQVAELMGVSRPTATALLSRALTKMQRQLRK
ncbi:MAG: sigma-70 family RNA polymerase sigma factor [Phycisphaerales bacterium]|nr:sigma-70 family RNA polymerase sigma factor [Phycisphaerales bacterium]